MAPLGQSTTPAQAKSSFAFQASILTWMAFQNAWHTIFMRYSRSRQVEHMYLPSVAVFWMEIIKMTLCLILVTVEEASVSSALKNIRKTVMDHPMDTLQVCIPSFVYAISNNLFYVAATYLDAATFAITSQLKLLTTAVFSVLILRKPLSRLQWISLLILFAGVSMVQLPSPTSTHSGHNSTSSSSASKSTVSSSKDNSLFGFCTAFVASFLAGFAGVYWEKILKSQGSHQGNHNASVWMRNIQLAVSSVPIALLTAFIEDGAIVREHGLLYGFDSIAWLTVSWSSIGGLSVAVCIKFTDNIRKNFATSGAIILSTVLSVYIFHFRPSIYFIIGASMVIGAMFVYAKAPGQAASAGHKKNSVPSEENGWNGQANGEMAPMIRIA